MKSVFSMLGLPEGFGVVILVFSFILMISPYFSGLDFGVFKVPDFSEVVINKLKILGPILFLIVVFLFIPVFPPESSKFTRPNATSNKAVDPPVAILPDQSGNHKNNDNKQRAFEPPLQASIPKKNIKKTVYGTPNDIQVIFDIEKHSSHKTKILYFTDLHKSIIFGEAFGGDSFQMLGVWNTKEASIVPEEYYTNFPSAIPPTNFVFKGDTVYYISGWNTRTIHLYKVVGDMEKQNFLAISKSGALLYSAKQNSFIVNRSFKHDVISVADVDGVIRSLALSSDLKYMAAGVDGRSYVFSCASGKKVAEIEESASSRNFQEHYLAFSPDSQYYTYITPKGNVHGLGLTSVVLIDVLNWKEKLRLSNDSAQIHSFAFSEDGRYIATGDDKPQIVIWDTNTGKAIQYLSSPHHTYSWPYVAIAISPNSNYLVASRFNFLEFWNIKTGNYLFRMDKRDKGYIARFPSGKFYVSKGAENYVSIVSELDKHSLADYQREHPDKLDALIVTQELMVEYLNK